MKKSFSLNEKIVARTLICLQLMTSLVAVSASRADGQPTAEETLLTRVYQIEGSGLRKSDMRQQVVAAVQKYERTSPRDGRQDRMSNALVSMHLYSQTDAKAIIDDVSASAAHLSTQEFSSTKEASQATQSELASILSKHPATGAQFSGCSATAFTVAGLGLAGGIIATVVSSEGHLSALSVAGDVGFGAMAASLVYLIFATVKC